MEEKAKQQLETMRRQHAELSAEMRNYQNQMAELQARMREVGQVLTAVNGGIVTLEMLLGESPAEQAPAADPGG